MVLIPYALQHSVFLVHYSIFLLVAYCVLLPLVTGYHSPEYFCNREDETGKILETIHNQRNTTLVSLRRMGKTGLIRHVFYHLAENKECSTHYMDLLPTSGLQDFVQ